MAGPQSTISTGKIARPSRQPHRLHGVTEQNLIEHTYFGLRWGLGIAAFLLPLVARWGEQILTDHSLPKSISGYYHTGMRNYFVATLIVVAAFLILYKGYSRWENHLLNIAGIATALIAFFPTKCDTGSTECASFRQPAMHITCAFIAFGSIGLVAVFLGGSTLDQLHNKQREQVFRTLYRALGIAMIVLPILTAILVRKDVASVYWVELVVLWVFVGYWAAKTVEFRLSGAEHKAICGVLPPPPQQQSPQQSLHSPPEPTTDPPPIATANTPDDRTRRRSLLGWGSE